MRGLCHFLTFLFMLLSSPRMIFFILPFPVHSQQKVLCCPHKYSSHINKLLTFLLSGISKYSELSYYLLGTHHSPYLINTLCFAMLPIFLMKIKLSQAEQMPYIYVLVYNCTALPIMLVVFREMNKDPKEPQPDFLNCSHHPVVCYSSPRSVQFIFCLSGTLQILIAS